MSNDNQSNNQYTLTILGQEWQLKRLLPHRLSASKKDKAYKERAEHFPLTPLDVELFGFHDEFELNKRKFDKHKLLLPNGLSVLEFQKQAKMLHLKPGVTKQQSYHILSLETFNKSYSELINEVQANLVNLFNTAFENIEYDRYAIFKSEDIGYPLQCPPRTLETLKLLADQGHIYSQLLVGILLACQGSINKGINYLLEAYTNRFTVALHIIAEFLTRQEDWEGALQCALIAFDINNSYRFTVDKVIQNMSCLMIDTNTVGDGTIYATAFGPGYMDLVHFTLHHVLTEDFQKLAKKYRPDWLPTPEEQEEEMRHFFSKWRSPKVNQTKSY